MQKLKRRYYYKVMIHESSFTDMRELAGASLTEVIDLAIKLYFLNWGKFPDSIDIKSTGSYCWN